MSELKPTISCSEDPDQSKYSLAEVIVDWQSKFKSRHDSLKKVEKIQTYLDRFPSLKQHGVTLVRPVFSLK